MNVYTYLTICEDQSREYENMTTLLIDSLSQLLNYLRQDGKILIDINY